MNRPITDRGYHTHRVLVFRGVGPNRKVMATWKLYIEGMGTHLTLGEMVR